MTILCSGYTNFVYTLQNVTNIFFLPLFWPPKKYSKPWDAVLIESETEKYFMLLSKSKKENKWKSQNESKKESNTLTIHIQTKQYYLSLGPFHINYLIFFGSVHLSSLFGFVLTQTISKTIIKMKKKQKSIENDTRIYQINWLG